MENNTLKLVDPTQSTGSAISPVDVCYQCALADIDILFFQKRER